MQKILQQVSYADYETFRKMALERCGWTVQKYNFRKQGRTKLTELERQELQKIADELNAPTV